MIAAMSTATLQSMDNLSMNMKIDSLAQDMQKAGINPSQGGADILQSLRAAINGNQANAASQCPAPAAGTAAASTGDVDSSQDPTSAQAGKGLLGAMMMMMQLMMQMMKSAGGQSTSQPTGTSQANDLNSMLQQLFKSLASIGSGGDDADGADDEDDDTATTPAATAPQDAYSQIPSWSQHATSDRIGQMASDSNNFINGIIYGNQSSFGGAAQ